MYKSKRQRINKAMGGKVVVRLNKYVRITAVEESRGYQTDYKKKTFFYLVKPGVFVKGITNDSRRKNFINHWKQKGINYTIVNKKLFNKLIS